MTASEESNQGTVIVLYLLRQFVFRLTNPWTLMLNDKNKNWNLPMVFNFRMLFIGKTLREYDLLPSIAALWFMLKYKTLFKLCIMQRCSLLILFFLPRFRISFWRASNCWTRAPASCMACCTECIDDSCCFTRLECCSWIFSRPKRWQ